MNEHVERLEAVSASSDTVAKILHARYADFRAHTIKEHFDAAVREGREILNAGEKAARFRQLRELLGKLEEQLSDRRSPDAVCGRKGLPARAGSWRGA